jgi:serine/threonine-protein kinase RsbW
VATPEGKDVHSIVANRPSPSTQEGVLHIRLPAVAAASSLFRDRVRHWLDGLQWPAQERDEVIAAVSEAVENVISHAYDLARSGEVILTAQVTRAPKGMRQAVIEVVDHGRWRPAPTDPGYRGHGFTIMRASMASVRVFLSKAGTWLQMRSRPVPP